MNSEPSVSDEFSALFRCRIDELELIGVWKKKGLLMTRAVSRRELWGRIADRFRGAVDEYVYQLWMDNTRLVRVDRDGVLLACRDSEVVQSLPNQDLLRAVVREVCGEDSRADLVVEPTFFSDRKEVIRSRKVGNRGLEKLIEWEENKVALSAARAFRDARGQNFPVLYMYGPSGVGKSAILNALAADLRDIGRPLLAVSMSAFVTQFALAAQQRELNRLRQRTRGVEFLFLDDIHELQSKRVVQDEIAATLNTLLERGHRVVVAGDRPPRDLKGLQPTIRNRLRSGMEVSITRPRSRSRVQFVQSLIRGGIRGRDREVIEYLADNGPAHLADLKDAVDASRANGTWSLVRVRNILAEFGTEENKLEQLSAATAEVFSVKESDLRGRTRARTVSLARQAACWVARRTTEFSYSEIGAWFGDRDHSTVIACVRRVDALRKTDQDYALMLERLEQEFSSRRGAREFYFTSR